MIRTGASLLITALLMLWGSAVAQTPDNLTPANEGVCDDLVYATPGLYGLCIAFCEAQHCVPQWDDDDPFAGCNPSSGRLLESYRNHMRPDDPDMPCVQPRCACRTDEELDGLRFPRDDDIVECMFDESAPDVYTDWDRWLILSQTYSTQMTTVAWVADADGPACSFWDICAEGENCLDVSRTSPITAEDYAICVDGLTRAAEDRELDCEPEP